MCRDKNLFFPPVNLSCVNFIIGSAARTQEGNSPSLTVYSPNYEDFCVELSLSILN